MKRVSVLRCVLMQPARPLPSHSPSLRTRAPLALVVHPDRAAQGAGLEIDWTPWYLTDEEDMGESIEHGRIIRVLLSALRQLARERGWGPHYLGSNHFFAWVPAKPLVRVSPDIYLLEGRIPEPPPKSWQTWLPGHHPPRFALEVVSDEWRKDYDDNPPKYWQLGCRELVIFDPERAAGRVRSKRRVALQLYRRAADGAFVRIYAGVGPVQSEELGAWLVVCPKGASVRLRVARDPKGRSLVPTASQVHARERQARQRAEAAKFAAEGARHAEKQARLAEEQARLVAEARVRQLEQRLQRQDD